MLSASSGDVAIGAFWNHDTEMNHDIGHGSGSDGRPIQQPSRPTPPPIDTGNGNWLIP